LPPYLLLVQTGEVIIELFDLAYIAHHVDELSFSYNFASLVCRYS